MFLFRDKSTPDVFDKLKTVNKHLPKLYFSIVLCICESHDQQRLVCAFSHNSLPPFRISSLSMILFFKKHQFWRTYIVLFSTFKMKLKITFPQIHFISFFFFHKLFYTILVPPTYIIHSATLNLPRSNN